MEQEYRGIQVFDIKYHILQLQMNNKAIELWLQILGHILFMNTKNYLDRTL